MSRKLKVVAVSGSLQRPSKTLVLVESILSSLKKELAIDIHLIELGAIADQFGGVTRHSDLPPQVSAELHAVENADLLIVASPVYRASFTGLFKHFFDFVHQDALIDVPVLLAASGGSERHSLVIDHQLRPLFSFFQALTLPIGVYASDSDFNAYQIDQPALQARIDLAVKRALPLLSHRETNFSTLPASAQVHH